MSTIIKIGTRDSQLALWQAKIVQQQLERLVFLKLKRMYKANRWTIFIHYSVEVWSSHGINDAGYHKVVDLKASLESRFGIRNVRQTA